MQFRSFPRTVRTGKIEQSVLKEDLPGKELAAAGRKLKEPLGEAFKVANMMPPNEEGRER